MGPPPNEPSQKLSLRQPQAPVSKGKVAKPVRPVGSQPRYATSPFGAGTAGQMPSGTRRGDSACSSPVAGRSGWR